MIEEDKDMLLDEEEVKGEDIEEVIDDPQTEPDRSEQESV